METDINKMDLFLDLVNQRFVIYIDQIYHSFHYFN
jgi:hypothetical protein